MIWLGLTVKILLEVDDEAAGRFKKSPPGFICIARAALGSEDLVVHPMNESGVVALWVGPKPTKLSDEAEAGQFMQQ